MTVNTATFVKSVADLTQLPEPNIPEFAFIGRSNVGKSSLINKLTNQKQLAKTSETPGKTQLINFFLVNKQWHLVDLPGYGYAKVPVEVKEKWVHLLRQYLLKRPNLLTVFLLIDIRHSPMSHDTEFLQWLGENDIPVSIVFTKADKLSAAKIKILVENYQAHILQSWDQLPPLFITSATTGKGRTELLSYISETAEIFKT